MRIIFRVDASQLIGSGHVMRCLTLANNLKMHEAETIFICRHLPEYLQSMLEQQHHIVYRLSTPDIQRDNAGYAEWLGVSQEEDAIDTINIIGNKTCDWMVVDHYALDIIWETSIRLISKNILVIDDLAQRKHACDLLLDQNLYLDMSSRYLHLVPSQCNCLLGPVYALLRPEFSVLRNQIKPRDGKIGRILVFFGGMDAINLTGRVLESLRDNILDDVIVDVIIGKQHPKISSIQALCEELGFICHIQTSEIAQLMSLADFSIGAGGTATWERCCLGLPTMAFIAAENQEKLIYDAAKAGLIIAAGNVNDALSIDIAVVTKKIVEVLKNKKLLSDISRMGMSLVTGDGVEKVRRAMRISGLRIRRANIHDSEKLFNWRNHSSIRIVSHTQVLITRVEHEKWFRKILSDVTRVLLLGVWQEKEIGVVRFDLKQNIAEISIYLNPELELKGWGNDLLFEAEIYLGRNYPSIDIINAHILPENVISQRFFERHGYRVNGQYRTKTIPTRR